MNTPGEIRIEPVEQDTDDARAAEALARAKNTFGWVPNTVRVMARGSAAAEIYLTAGELNKRSTLTDAQRESIAIVTAAHNDCSYCLTAHSLAARLLGVSEEDVMAAREGRSSDERTAALLQLAVALLRERGHVSDEQLAQARRAGIEDAILIDVVSSVAENVLGNLVNNLAHTPIDELLLRGVERTLIGVTQIEEDG